MSQAPDRLTQALDQLADDLTAVASIDSRLAELTTATERIAVALEVSAGQHKNQSRVLGDMRRELESLAVATHVRAQAEADWRQTITDAVVSLLNAGHGYVDSFVVPLVAGVKTEYDAHIGALNDIGAGVSDLCVALNRLEQRYSLAADDQRQAGGNLAAAIDDVAGAIRNHR